MTIEKHENGEREDRREQYVSMELCESWVTLIEYCKNMNFGDILDLEIKDGLPTYAEDVKRKIKLI